jgi:hypothetical protein
MTGDSRTGIPALSGAETRVGLHVKRLLLLCDLNKNKSVHKL